MNKGRGADDGKSQCGEEIKWETLKWFKKRNKSESKECNGREGDVVEVHKDGYSKHWLYWHIYCSQLQENACSWEFDLNAI